MTDSTLNRFISYGTTTQRTAFTPSPPTPASGPSPGYTWWDTTLQALYCWDVGSASWKAAATGGGGSSTIVQPQGRLTLVTGVPVITSDQTAKTAVYWTPCVGNQAPIYGGSSWSMISTATDITYNLGTSAHLSGSLYDLFLYSNAGALALGTGPAWTSSTTRSAAIAMLGGIWTNNATITLTLSGGGSTTSIAANQATYVGTFYATANGQTGMAFRPAAATGGSAPILALYNAYNRISTGTRCNDSTSSWTYGSTTWRTSNNSSSNRISWVDGLGQSFADCAFNCLINNGATVALIGLNLDSTSATPYKFGIGGTPNGGCLAAEIFTPSLGFHYVQAMEANGSAGTATYYGANGTASEWYQINLKIDM